MQCLTRKKQKNTAREKEKEASAEEEKRRERGNPTPPRGEQAGWSRIKQYPFWRCAPKIRSSFYFLYFPQKEKPLSNGAFPQE